MRLVRFGDWATGAMVGDDQFADIGASARALATEHPGLAQVFAGPGPADWQELIRDWDQLREEVQALLDLAYEGHPSIARGRLADVKWLPPLPNPTARIFALGANFADHAAAAKTVILGREVTEQEVLAERDQGLPPWGFVVIPQTVIGAGSEIIAPAGTTKLDYEAEVAVVLRTGGRMLDREDTQIWGYTAWNDLSSRDHFFGLGTAVDRGILVWALSKNFETANACGPWMVVDEPYDVNAVRMRSFVNGEQRQSSSSSEMIYSFGDTVEHLSTYLELLPGDMLVSGTPAGTAVEQGVDGPYLAPGDVVEVEIEGVGVLRNPIGQPLRPRRS